LDQQTIALPTLVDLPTVPSDFGDLVFIQADRVLRFAIRRVYYIHDIPAHALRGGHAHKTCHALVVAVKGAMTVGLEAQDGNRFLHRLDHPSIGLYVPPLYWRVIRDFTAGAICLALASENYDPDEYLRDHDAFRQYRPTGHGDSIL
jgi:WxcM-like, C-terminal